MMADYCKSHPRYSAKRMPKSLCGKCFELYFLAHPEDKQRVVETYTDLAKLQDDFTR